MMLSRCQGKEGMMILRLENGPVKMEWSEWSCGLCKWHRQTMVHSGRHPLYHHYCSHPDVTHDGFELVSPFVAEHDGRFIGEGDRTPQWCPAKGGRR